jgi:hypothetical protein
VDESTLVDSGVPPKRTCAPETNLLPVTTNVKLPRFVAAGEIPVIAGVGFSSVTLDEPLAVESAALVARIVNVLGFGSVFGAVYFPLVSIVPMDADPPAVPFTDHVTDEFCVPLTDVVKVYESPARTFALFGVTQTLTPALGGGFGSGVWLDETLPVQPASVTNASAPIPRAKFAIRILADGILIKVRTIPCKQSDRPQALPTTARVYRIGTGLRQLIDITTLILAPRLDQKPLP